MIPRWVCLYILNVKWFPEYDLRLFGLRYNNCFFLNRANCMGCSRISDGAVSVGRNRWVNLERVGLYSTSHIVHTLEALRTKDNTSRCQQTNIRSRNYLSFTWDCSQLATCIDLPPTLHCMPHKRQVKEFEKELSRTEVSLLKRS